MEFSNWKHDLDEKVHSLRGKNLDCPKANVLNDNLDLVYQSTDDNSVLTRLTYVELIKHWDFIHVTWLKLQRDGNF